MPVVPVVFLPEQQMPRFGRFSEERTFFLDDTAHVLVGRPRGGRNRLGFPLQLATMRYLATFLVDSKSLRPRYRLAATVPDGLTPDAPGMNCPPTVRAAATDLGRPKLSDTRGDR